jgi:hypothetical protein
VSANLDALVPDLRAAAHSLVADAGASGLLPRVTSTLRTHSSQLRLYSRYLQGRAQYPTAFPGTSAHEYGEAFDLIVTPMEALADVGPWWESQYGGAWGGARDPIHFEIPGASQAHQHRNIAFVADLLVGATPGISEVELGATLLSFGFPQSEVLQFLSSPISYLSQHPESSITSGFSARFLAAFKAILPYPL